MGVSCCFLSCITSGSRKWLKVDRKSHNHGTVAKLVLITFMVLGMVHILRVPWYRVKISFFARASAAILRQIERSWLRELRDIDATHIPLHTMVCEHCIRVVEQGCGAKLSKSQIHHCIKIMLSCLELTTKSITLGKVRVMIEMRPCHAPPVERKAAHRMR
eukprot:SAG31_NODE_186_length_20918_cov_26.890917_14_plen_161_part_00